MALNVFSLLGRFGIDTSDLRRELDAAVKAGEKAGRDFATKLGGGATAAGDALKDAGGAAKGLGDNLPTEKAKTFSERLRSMRDEAQAGLRPLQDVQKELKEQERALRDTAAAQDRNSKEYQKTVSELVTVRRELRETTSQIETQQSAIDRLAGTLTRVGIGLTAAITAPLTAVGIAGLKSAVQLESFSDTLTVLIGDGERARRVFDDLYQFSATTPFSWASLTEGTRVLSAFGTEAEDILPTLEMLGDLAAGVQTPLEELAEIYGQVQVTGRASMMDITRLAQRGIPVYEALAGVLNTNQREVRSLVTAGQVGFPELEAALRSLTTEGGKFHGMMQAQAQTTAGRINTLRDSWEQVTDTVGTLLLPALQALLDTGQHLLDRFNNLDEGSKNLFVTLGGTLAATGPLLLGLGTLARLLPTIAEGFGMVRTALAFLTGPVGLLTLAAGAAAVLIYNLAGSNRADQALTAAIDAVNEAIGDNDTSALRGALRVMADHLDGDASAAVQRLIDKLGRVSEVTEAMLLDVRMATLQAQDIAERAALEIELKALVERNAALMGAEYAAAQTIISSAEGRGGRERLNAAEQAELDRAQRVMSGTARDTDWFYRDQVRQSQVWDRIEFLTARIESYEPAVQRLQNAPERDTTTTTTTTTPPPTVDPKGLLPPEGEAADAIRAWAANLEAQLGLGLIDPRTVFDALTPALADLREQTIAALTGADASDPTYQALAKNLGILQGLYDNVARSLAVTLTAMPTATIAGARDITGPMGGLRADVDMTGLRSAGTVAAELAEARRQLTAAGTLEAQIAARQIVDALEEELKRLGGVQLIATPTATVVAPRDITGPMGGVRADVTAPRPLTAPDMRAELTSPQASIASLEAQAADARRRAASAATYEQRLALTQQAAEYQAQGDELRRQVTPVPLTAEPTASVAAARDITGPMGGVQATVTMPPTRAEELEAERKARREMIDGMTAFNADDGPLANLGRGMLGLAIDRIPLLGTAIQGFVEGGPMGAVVAIFTELLGRSEAFAEIMGKLDGILAPIVDMLDALLTALMPIIDVAISLVQAAFAPLAVIIEKVLAPVITAVAGWIVAIYNGFARVVNAVLGWLGVRLPLIGEEDAAEKDAGGIIAQLQEERDEVGRQLADARTEADIARLNRRLREIDDELARLRRLGLETDEPGAGDGERGGALTPETPAPWLFSGTAQSVQFAVATPLVEAAHQMLGAATLMAETFSVSDPTGGMGAFTEALREATPVLDRLAREGVAVNITGGGGATVAPGALR